MTEQEAQVLAARLTRIWNPIDVPQWRAEENNLSFFCRVAEGVTLTVYGSYVSLDEECSYAAIEHRDGEVDAVCTAPSCSTQEDFDLFYQEVERFAFRWMDYFRRNAWLSGLPFEASAHEKAEWMQGFASEELKTWNLKF